MNMSKSPWSSGPGEILKHALDLLADDSDVNRRLAMICIDNSVELMLKTYLDLPSRITGLEISRADRQAFSSSFPKLLDAIEAHASDKIDGLDLGEIEWYHRLRNQLYHQGNGLTVERTKVDVYAELAKLLFSNLFGYELVPDRRSESDLLGEFMANWIALERELASIDTNGKGPKTPLSIARRLMDEGKISRDQLEKIEGIRRIRNEVVHGLTEHEAVITRHMINQLGGILRSIVDRK